MTMEEEGPPMDWAADPLIEHPTRRSIVEAIRRRGPLSASELRGVLDGPDCGPAHVNYHVNMLVGSGILMQARLPSAGASVENIYYAPVS
jgi:hypothetical protein